MVQLICVSIYIHVALIFSCKISPHQSLVAIATVLYFILRVFGYQMSVCFWCSGIPGFHTFYNSVMLTFAVINLHFRHQLAVSFTFSGLVHLFLNPCPASLHLFQHQHLNLKAPLSFFTTHLAIARCKPLRSLQSSLGKGSSKVPGWTGCQTGS